MSIRLSGKFLALLACSALLCTAACSKENQADTAATEPRAAKGSGDSKGQENVDLEQAIADPGPKTVTAVGANGDTKVLPVGETTLAETDTYVVHAHVPDGATAGAETVVTIRLTPKTGWKINQEFPTKLKVSVPDGVTMEKSTLVAADAGTFSEKKAVFELKMKVSSSGPKEFKADFRFAVCTDATCDPKKAELSWKFDVI